MTDRTHSETPWPWPRGRLSPGSTSASVEAQPHGPDEGEAQAEYEAALEVKLVWRAGRTDELVLELDGGRLRVVSKKDS